MEHMWPWMALGFSFCGAVIIGFNHWAKLDSARLVILRWLGVAPLAFLSGMTLPWPQNPDFYLVAAGMGVLLVISDIVLFHASHHHGGRLAALYIPMKMLLGFALWGLIAPASVTDVLAEPWRIVLVAAGFGLCSASLLAIRKHEAGWTALMAVVPVAVLLALGDVVAKSALNSSAVGWAAVVGSATAFLLVTNTVGSILGLVFTWRKQKGFAMPTQREVLLSTLFGVILMAGLSVFLVTLAAAPNPGYVGAITMLSGFWLALHGYFHHGERANWWSGILLLGGAIAVAVGAA